MTTVPNTATAAAPDSVAPSGAPPDHRGSPIPTWGMIASRFKELRKRRGLMITLTLVTVGIPTVFVSIRLLLHAVAPKTYGPAGGYSIYTALVSGVLYVFGFIVAATLGATAGSADLTEGMFRHLVVTGRSRLALYFARIPAGFAIIVPLVAVGFTIVCAVCVLAAPTQLNFSGVNVPAGMSRAGLERWAANHADEVICNFDLRVGPSSPIGSVVNNVPCGNGPGGGASKALQPPQSQGQPQPTPDQIRNAAVLIARMDYSDYARQFLYPSNSLMIIADYGSNSKPSSDSSLAWASDRSSGSGRSR
jgi:hypothetical protein